MVHLYGELTCRVGNFFALTFENKISPPFSTAFFHQPMEGHFRREEKDNLDGRGVGEDLDNASRRFPLRLPYVVDVCSRSFVTPNMKV
jgi:hypothetical protein